MVKQKNPELEQRRKQHIVATCYELLSRESHGSVTLTRIAEEAGVSKGMLTYYFDSKDQLFVETIGYFLTLQVKAIGDLSSSDLTTEERLRQLVEAVLPGRAELEQEIRFMVEVWSFAKTRPDVLDKMRLAYLAFRSECAAMVERGVQEGVVSAADADWIHLVIHALLDGMSFQLVIDPELDVASVRQRLITLLERLLRT